MTASDKLAPQRRYPSRGAHGRVVHAIGQAIMSGDLKPGSYLPREAELMEQFQVSRTAIREATKVLAAKGLIEARQKAGTMVRLRKHWNLLDPDVLAWQPIENLSPKFVEDLVELRQVVEPIAVRLAALRADEIEIGVIEAAYRRMEDNAGDRDRFYEADLAFHMAIFAACHNELIDRLSGIVSTVIEFSFQLQKRSLIEPKESLSIHHAVLDAIRARDPVAAEAAMGVILGRARAEASRRIKASSD